MVRQNFELKNNNVYTNNLKVNDLTFEPEIKGMRKKVKLMLNGQTIAYLKSNNIAGTDYMSDYAEVASKKICDLVGIKCAETLLANITGIHKSQSEIEQEKLENEKSEAFLATLPPSVQEQARKHRAEQNLAKAKQPQKGVLSYNYLAEKRYRDCQVLNVADLCENFNKITGRNQPSSANGYMSMLKNLQENTEFAKSMGINENFVLDENLKSDFIKLSMFSYFTGQSDMTKYNIDVVLINTPQGKKLELAPLYDNSESFGLSGVESKNDINQEEIDYVKNSISETINLSDTSKLTIKEQTPLDITEQAKELADVIHKDPLAKEIYEKFKNIDIESVVNELNVDESSFEIVNFAITELFSTRMNNVEKCLDDIKQENFTR